MLLAADDAFRCAVLLASYAWQPPASRQRASMPFQPPTAMRRRCCPALASFSLVARRCAAKTAPLVYAAAPRYLPFVSAPRAVMSHILRHALRRLYAAFIAYAVVAYTRYAIFSVSFIFVCAKRQQVPLFSFSRAAINPRYASGALRTTKYARAARCCCCDKRLSPDMASIFRAKHDCFTLAEPSASLHTRRATLLSRDICRRVSSATRQKDISREDTQRATPEPRHVIDIAEIFSSSLRYIVD